MGYGKKIFDITVSSLFILGTTVKYIIDKSIEHQEKKDSNKGRNKKYKTNSNINSSLQRKRKDIKTKIDTLYMELDKEYEEFNDIKNTINRLYSQWNSSGVKSYNGDCVEAKEMYSLKSQKDACYTEINAIKTQISNLKKEITL
jgi:predicted RNase H-like nuclease (RuvC/YqgF family)